MFQKNMIIEVPPDSPGFYSNVFLVCKASGGWRPVINIKRLDTHIFAPHFCSVHCKLSPEYLQKRRQHVQDRPAGCILSCTNPSKQQKEPSVCFRVQSVSIPSTSLRSEYSPPGLRHTVAGYLHRLGISVIAYLNDWLIYHPDRQVLLYQQSQLLNTLD